MEELDIIDHYSVLGLPSGEEGAKLSRGEVVTAYKRKCKALHPDKRPGDCNAHHEFLKLQESYDVLKDADKRRRFDLLLMEMEKKKKLEKKKLEESLEKKKLEESLEKKKLEESLEKKLKESLEKKKLKESGVKRQRQEEETPDIQQRQEEETPDNQQRETKRPTAQLFTKRTRLSNKEILHAASVSGIRGSVLVSLDKDNGEINVCPFPIEGEEDEERIWVEVEVKRK